MGAVIPTEGQLVARCRAGDAAAWNELVERFSRYVYAICSQGFRLSEHDAEDVFQDVFTRVYTHLDRLRDDDAFRPWLAQLTRRTCIDRIRSGGREAPVEELDLPPGTIASRISRCLGKLRAEIEGRNWPAARSGRKR